LSHSAHDMDHVMRVYALALRLAKHQKVKVDTDILKAAVLLHDIARIKEDTDQTGKTDHAVLGARLCAPILKKVGFPVGKIKRVQECILSHRHRTENEPKTIEAKILFDADKLDGIGAIGIARLFVWVGGHDTKIYRDVDLDTYIAENMGGKMNGRIQNKTKHSPQIEYKTKLIFTVNRLYTAQAKKIGKERLAYLDSFMKRLEREVKDEL